MKPCSVGQHLGVATQDLRHPAVPMPDRRAALAGVGVLLGAIAGTVLGFLTSSTQLFLPVLLALLCAMLGAVIGVLEAERRLRRPIPAPEPEPAPPAAPLHLAPPEAAPDIPAWLTDPEDGERKRLWDGERWTAHVWAPRRA